MKTLTKLALTGALICGLNSCGDNEKAQEDKQDTTKSKEIKIKNIGEALDYSLKFTALELIKQGKELDSLNNYYDLLDKKSDTLLSFWKKKIYN